MKTQILDIPNTKTSSSVDIELDRRQNSTNKKLASEPEYRFAFYVIEKIKVESGGEEEDETHLEVKVCTESTARQQAIWLSNRNLGKTVRVYREELLVGIGSGERSHTL